MTQWKPNATVAAIIERDGRFLLVEEQTKQGIRFNQPAGHWEYGETLQQAVIRETQEETGWLVEPYALLGIYTAPAAEQCTYLRFAFLCRPVSETVNATLDDGIIAAHWLTLEQIRACQSQHRSHIVLLCVEDALAGKHYPLSLIQEFPPC